MPIEINVSKQFKTYALNVNCNLGRETLGILGPSGAGKSLLLKLIAGLVEPDQGTIRVNGKTYFDSEKGINLPPRDRQIGMLFQQYALFPHLSVEDNIAFGLQKHSKPERDAIVQSLLDRFHLTDLSKRRPRQLSGGQQQRVALARALAVEPEILLLDEPFSALDDHLKSQLMTDMHTFLKDFQGTVLLVTHNRDEAYRLSDRIAVLNAGDVEALGPKDQLFEQPATLACAQMTGCKNLSSLERLSNHRAYAAQWGTNLLWPDPLPMDLTHVGIRAHHIELAPEETTENLLTVEIVDQLEAPFATTLLLRSTHKSKQVEDVETELLQWEVSKEMAKTLCQCPGPLRIVLKPERLLQLRKKL